MEKIKKYIRYSLLFVIGVLTLGSLNSCRKLIDENPSSTKILTSTVFTDSVTVQATLAGMYSNLSGSATGPYNTTIATLTGFSSDELNYVGTTYTTYINNTILTTDIYNQAIWTSSYSAIYIANSIINGVTNSSKISQRFKNQALGEALFVRAFCYFYLTNLYGDVPLILGTDVAKNSATGRTPSATVYSQIISDLKLSQSYLPADYSASGGTARTRANKFAATALLARVYLYQKDWVNAEAQATTVINSSLFSLPTDLTTVFTPASQEAIFQFYNGTIGYTYYASNVIPNPVTKVPTYVFTSQQMAAFQPGDKRQTTWIGSLLYSGTTYYYPYKYKSITSGANAEYYTILRIAEQYLIRAEARAEQGNTTEAIADLNMIHNPTRVGLPVYSGATDQASVLSATMKERQVELFAEWGHRWLDLKRTNAANAILGAEKPTTWTSTAVLYPIPLTEMTNNPKLVQNPGYH
jgi:hypothetical protein